MGRCADVAQIRTVLGWGERFTEHAPHYVPVPGLQRSSGGRQSPLPGWERSELVAERLAAAASLCLSHDPGALPAGIPQRGCRELAVLCALQLGREDATACGAIAKLAQDGIPAAAQAAALRVAPIAPLSDWHAGAQLTVAGRVGIVFFLWALNGTLLGVVPWGDWLLPCAPGDGAAAWLTSTSTHHTLRCSFAPAARTFADKGTVVAEPHAVSPPAGELLPVPVHVSPDSDDTASCSWSSIGERGGQRSFLLSDADTAPPLVRYAAAVTLIVQSMGRSDNGVTARIRLCVSHSTAAPPLPRRLRLAGAPCSRCDGDYRALTPATAGGRTTAWRHVAGGRWIVSLPSGRWAVSPTPDAAAADEDALLSAGFPVADAPHLGQLPPHAPPQRWRTALRTTEPNPAVHLSATDPGETPVAVASLSARWLWHDWRQAYDAVCAAGGVACFCGLLLAAVAWLGHARAQLGGAAPSPPSELTVSCAGPVPAEAMAAVAEACGQYTLLLEASPGLPGLPQWRRRTFFAAAGRRDLRLRAAGGSPAEARWELAATDGRVFARTADPVAGQGLPPTAAVSGWVSERGVPLPLLVTQPCLLAALQAVVPDPAQAVAAAAAFLRGTGQALALAVWLGACAVYVEYKHQVSFKRLLPAGLDLFEPMLWAALAAQAAQTLILLWEQCSVAVALIDWEPPPRSGRALPVWRRVYCANAVARLSTRRSWLTTWAVCWTLIFEAGIGYRVLTAADPRATDRWDWALLPVANPSGGGLARTEEASHPLLRVAISGFILVMSALVWAAVALVAHGLWETQAELGVEHPFRRLAALCSDCNVSLLFLPRTTFRGYYLHGQKPAGGGVPPAAPGQQTQLPPASGPVTAEVDRAALSADLLQEMRGGGLRPWRGVQQRYDGLHWAQDCEVLIPPGLRQAAAELRGQRPLVRRRASGARRCYELLRRERVSGWGRSRVNSFDSSAPDGGLEGPPGDGREQQAAAATEQLRDALQAALPAAQPSPVLHSALGVVPDYIAYGFGFPAPGMRQPLPAEQGAGPGPPAQGSLVLIADGGGPDAITLALTTPGWARCATLLGVERDLFVLEATLFLCVDAATASVYLAAAAVWALHQGVRAARDIWGIPVLVSGLGVDPRLVN